MEIQVKDNDIRLDKYLSDNTTYSRSLILKMLKEDYILVNGKKVKPSYLVQENDGAHIILKQSSKKIPKDKFSASKEKR